MTAPPNRTGVPPATQKPETTPPHSRLVSWFVTSVIVGWVLAYNVLRIGGRSPRGAALVSLLIGLGIGAVIFMITVFIWQRVVGSGRYRPHHLEEIPPPTRLDSRQRTALDLLWPAVAIMAIVALVVGVVLAVDWYQNTGSRSTTKIVIACWDLLVGSWLLLEANELRGMQGEAVESIGMAAMLTAVLAGVALSRNMFDAGQGGLIVLSGIAGALAYFAGWRLLGSRGLPLASLLALVVAALAVILPLTV